MLCVSKDGVYVKVAELGVYVVCVRKFYMELKLVRWDDSYLGQSGHLS